MSRENDRLVDQLAAAGALRTAAIIHAFRRVDRKDFVPPRCQRDAYRNEPLPIGEGQFISQPQTVADMTEALQPAQGQNVLEVGSGSGYQAAILAEIAGTSGSVIATERIRRLCAFAKKNLRTYKNVTVIHCDGSRGYAQRAPYDRIIVTASAAQIPEPLTEQLKPGGRVVIPVGNEMFLLEKNDGIRKTFIGHYSFVPLVEGGIL